MTNMNGLQLILCNFTIRSAFASYDVFKKDVFAYLIPHHTRKALLDTLSSLLSEGPDEYGSKNQDSISNRNIGFIQIHPQHKNQNKETGNVTDTQKDSKNTV